MSVVDPFKLGDLLDKKTALSFNNKGMVVSLLEPDTTAVVGDGSHFVWNFASGRCDHPVDCLANSGELLVDQFLDGVS